jgi:hypothetical protein
MTAFHASFRFFSVTGGDAEEWWFGGSCDMTPAYGSEADAVHFHTTLKAWCGRHPHGRYAEWKAACDDYFAIPHRGEMRGPRRPRTRYLTTQHRQLGASHRELPKRSFRRKTALPERRPSPPG